MKCPVCGNDTTTPSVGALRGVQASPPDKKLIDALVSAYPEAVPADVLVGVIYTRKKRPKQPYDGVGAHVRRAKKRCETVGWTIINTRTKGQGMRAQYALVKLTRGGEAGIEIWTYRNVLYEMRHNTASSGGAR